MTWMRKTGVHYALLLVVLLAIAAVAVSATLDYIGEIVNQEELTVITVIVWALTMGFMLIAGAFGLWAVHFATEAESLRRMGSLVDAMDYIRDGLLAIDRQGRITGMNPTAATLFGDDARKARFADICPEFATPQFATLLNSDAPVEFEHGIERDSESRILRFRSQPSKGILLLLISDVTALARNREKSRRAAWLQLLGHMAKGLANDFNDLLCGISGHAALLVRRNIRPVDVPTSASAIQDCANRGILLARQLMQLTTGDESSQATLHTWHHISTGVELIESSLPTTWSVSKALEIPSPPVNIPPVLLEHLVHSLGLITADASPASLRLSVMLKPPPYNARTIDDVSIVAALIITTADSEMEGGPLTPRNISEAGIITTVVSSLITQSGGRLECFTTADGAPLFRILLPEADPDILAVEDPGTLALGLEAYVACWHILIDSSLSGSEECVLYFRKAGIRTTETAGIVELLSAIEKDEKLDAAAMHADVLGSDPQSLLRAISKLCPDAGIVLQPPPQEQNHVPGVVYVSNHITPRRLLHAMIDARSHVRGCSPAHMRNGIQSQPHTKS